MTDQGDGQQSERVHEWGEAVPASSGPPKPGDIIIDPDLTMAPNPLVGHDVSTRSKRTSPSTPSRWARCGP